MEVASLLQRTLYLMVSLHEEFNKLGDKGMPVVKCKNNSCEKK
jgi:hypothetical protein